MLILPLTVAFAIFPGVMVPQLGFYSRPRQTVAMESDPGPSPAHLARFIRAVAVLALPAADQGIWLGSSDLDKSLVDEIALEFDDGYRLVPQFIARAWLPETATEPLEKLDRLLVELSGPSGPWRLEDLHGDRRWQQVRVAALQALVSIR